MARVQRSGTRCQRRNGRAVRSPCQDCCTPAHCFCRYDPCDGVGESVYAPCNCGAIIYGGKSYILTDACVYCICPPGPLARNQKCLPPGVTVVPNPICAPNGCGVVPCGQGSGCGRHSITGEHCAKPPTDCCCGEQYDLVIRKQYRTVNWSFAGCVGQVPAWHSGTFTYTFTARYRFCGNNDGTVIYERWTSRAVCDMECENPPGCQNYNQSGGRPFGAVAFADGFNCGKPRTDPIGFAGPYYGWFAMLDRCNGPAFYPQGGFCTFIDSQQFSYNCRGGTLSQTYRSYNWGPGETDCSNPTAGHIAATQSINVSWQYIPIRPCTPACDFQGNEPPFLPGCPDQLGPCCVNGACTMRTAFECFGLGGIWGGCCKTCADVNCAQPPLIRACCRKGLPCFETTHEACDQIGGDWFSTLHCTDNPCPIPPDGACCLGLICQIMGEAACAANGGNWRGAGTLCTPSLCACRGACCIPHTHNMWDCQDSTESECVGIWHGCGTLCEGTDCTIQPVRQRIQIASGWDTMRFGTGGGCVGCGDGGTGGLIL